MSPGTAGAERSSTMTRRTMPERTAWLSRKDWRRLLALHLAGKLSEPEFERMKARLARVRTGPVAARRPAPPRLRLVPARPAEAAARPGPTSWRAWLDVLGGALRSAG